MVGETFNAGIVYDVFRSTHLKREIRWPGPRLAAEDDSWQHLLARLNNHAGQLLTERGAHHVCPHGGDRCSCLFRTVGDAVQAAIRLQQSMCDFNERESLQWTPLSIHIGVGHGPTRIGPADVVGTVDSGSLDEAGRLVGHCPPGHVLLSKSAYGILESRSEQMPMRPGPEVDGRPTCVLLARAELPLQREQAGILAPKKFTPQQQRSMPLVVVPSWDVLRPPAQVGLTSLAQCLRDKVAVVLGETREAPEQSSPIHHAAATSDAVGAVECVSALPANSDVVGAVDEWEDTQDLAFKRSVVIIGSPATNLYAHTVNQYMRPARFDASNTSLLVYGPGSDEVVARYPKEEHSPRTRHYGLVLLCRNPFGPGTLGSGPEESDPPRWLLWVAGITGMATQVAARFARDIVAASDPDVFLKERGLRGQETPIGVIVRASPEGPWQADEYHRRWRIAGYEVEQWVLRDV